jgi:anti-sigma B factor antagonist
VIDHQVAGTTVVALNGDFDQSQHDRLDDAFAAALGSSLVVLDLERTRYFDSTVLSCLMRLHKTMLERGGRLVLVRVPQIVHRLLDICGLTRLVEIRDGFDDIEADRIARGGGLRRIELIAGTEER